MKRNSIVTCLLVLVGCAVVVGGDSVRNPNHLVRYDQFVKLTGKLQSIREERLISVKTFLKMEAEENTIILDTRSRWAFDQIHIKGARHLNFSDFTEKKLSDAIPDKNTKILIYCNNNFIADDPVVEVAALASKSPALALNIPTFINLWGYGYENVYELGDLLPLSNAGVPLEGDKVKK